MQASAGNNAAARNAFLTAAKFYGIARFPAKTLPGQAEAYLKHLDYYRRAGEFFDPPLVVVDIPFDGQHIQGYLKRVLDDGDRKELDETIQQYRLGYIPLVVPITLLKHHFRRNPHEYIDNSWYMSPHPGELMLHNAL